MTLSTKQQQLVLTAMDASASPNEAAVAARLFFRSLRSEYPDGHAFLAALTTTAQPKEPDWGAVICPFKKYKGRPLRECDPDYLAWILDKIDDLSPRLRKAMTAVLEAQQFSTTDS